MSFLKSLITPAGVMLPFGGAVAPDGWLLCNGASVSRATYSKLFGAIGSAHGSGDGSTTFTLPDTRGRFLRGVDGGVARDPDRASRTAAASGGNTGDLVGSVQVNATAKNGLSTAASTATGSVSGSVASTNTDHGHGYRGVNSAGGLTANQGAGLIEGPVNNTTGSMNSNSSHSHSWSGSFSGGVAAAQAITGDNETRPVNVNVNHIIKI
jgi:hypothetical protein